MKYYLIAGEASGDLHGANLIKAIRKRDANAQFRVWGGDKMEAAGAELVKHYRDLAFMGIAEVIANLGTILKNMAFCKKDLLGYQPDVLILVDYPGFNLRMAKFAHQHGLKVIFYISPTIWAWKQSRIKIIKKYVDRMIVILPFEKAFYARFDYQADFAGHPLLDELREEIPVDREKFIRVNKLDEKPIVAVLPGSRMQEIKKMLPALMEVEADFPDYQFVVAGMTSVSKQAYSMEGKVVKIVFDQTHALLRHAAAALVTSGTATLETALLGTPQVVVYKTSPLTYAVGKLLVHLRFFSLVNLIMDKEVVTELLQKDFSGQRLSTELRKILFNKSARKKMLNAYTDLLKKLGEPGVSDRIAKIITEENSLLKDSRPSSQQV